MMASVCSTGRISRGERLSHHRERCLILVKYLQSLVYPPDISKNEARNIKNQAKTHKWDAQRKELVYIGAQQDLQKKVVIEIDDIIEILHQYHSNPMGGHSGINGTLAKISKFYTWPGMKEDIVEYCNSCDRCQRHNKLKTQAPELKSIKVKGPLELVGMDLIGPLPTTDDGFKYVLTFTDYYTKFVDFYPLKEKAALGIARSIKSFVNRWGCPKWLLSDQGREFTAQINTDVCRQLGIKRSVTSAYHPQTNGLDERTNQTLKTRLAKLTNERQSDWNEFLDDVAFSIRTQKQASTKYSPFFLMFGRQPRTPLEMEEISDSMHNKIEDVVTDMDLDEMVSKRADVMTSVDQQVQKNVAQAQLKQQIDYGKRKGKGVKVFNFTKGDLVLRRAMKNVGRKGGKMEALWTGPYRIVELDCHQRITLAYPETGVPLKVKVPYDQVRPHSSSELHKLLKEVSVNSSSDMNLSPPHGDTGLHEPSMKKCKIEDNVTKAMFTDTDQHKDGPEAKAKLVITGPKSQDPCGDVNGTVARKRKRCGTCDGCTTKNCGKCSNCLDMRSFGGKGALKKCCKMRQCKMICPDTNGTHTSSEIAAGTQHTSSKIAVETHGSSEISADPPTVIKRSAPCNNKPVSTIGTCQVYKADLDTLTSKMWLNDKIVDAYLYLIMEEANKKESKSAYCITSFFYIRLTRFDCDKITKNWMKVDYFSYRKLIIPICQNSHWLLAIVDFNEKEMRCYDSLKGDGIHCLTKIRDCIARIDPSLDFSTWKMLCPKDIPVQTNFYDCGVFLCMYARFQAFDIAFNFCQDVIPQLREKMKTEIKTKTLF